MNITEKIESLTHDELKQLCIEQNQTALELMQQLAQKEAEHKQTFEAFLHVNAIEQRQKSQLVKAGELANICTTLAGKNEFLRQYSPLMEALNEFDNFNLKSIDNEQAD